MLKGFSRPLGIAELAASRMANLDLLLGATVGEQHVLGSPKTLRYCTENGSGSAVWDAIAQAGILWKA